MRFHTRLLWRLSTLLQPHKLSCCGEVWRPPHPAAHMAARAHRDTHVGGRELHGARHWNPNGPARASWATLAAIKWIMSARPVHVVKNTHQRLGLACIAAPKFKVWHRNRGASFKNWHKFSRALHTFTPCLAKLVWRVLWRAPHFFIPSGKSAVENSSKSVENVPLVWNLKH